MALSNPIGEIPTIPFEPDLAQPLSFDPGRPLALLPVRLETRFAMLSQGGAELRVRVYPDSVHLDSHEPELTAEELTWGKHFWEETWRAASDEEARKRAWRQLAERFDARRAAWVARALAPRNPADRPQTPVAADQPLPVAITFPTPPGRSDSWTRAPCARGLPKRWWIFGYFGGQLVVRGAGNPIPDELATGPDPAGPDDAVPDTELAIDDGMRWMVDFAEAEKVGMGIRLRLTTDEAQRGFDILLVFGTRAAPDSPDHTEDLVALLDAHHYTEGLAFLLQGTPSNNTADAPSGFSTLDPGEEASYLAERATPAFRPGDGSNADVIATALGLRDAQAAALANLANATATEPLNARHMNRALWPATMGYFLTHMMGAPLTPDDVAWAREHFVDQVRAAGPLPALRIGRQPYGVLPITSLRLWKPRSGEEAQFARDLALRDFLLRLRDVWHSFVPRVPRIGRTGRPEQDITEIFAMDGISSAYGVRHLVGETYLRSLWSSLVDGDQTLWWLKQQEFTRAGLTRVGLDWDPRLAHATYSGWHTVLRGPVAQAEPGEEDALLSPNYISLLLEESDLDRLRNETLVEPRPRALLYALLRHALLLEYWMAAARLTSTDITGSRVGFIHPEREIVEDGSTPPTVWELLNRAAPGVTDDTLWRFLSGLESPPADPAVAARVAPLLELRESLAHLQDVGAAKLQRYLSGTLDLGSHRLDAWITSFATKRLSELRRAGATGIVLGGYGWVLNLRPAAPAIPETPPAGETGAFFRPGGNPGFTHTPSLAQASTVAVLRSGHLSHADGDTKDLLAIDLSSERVRLAAWLLDGVRQGQSLGALLGYRFERRLQDARLGHFIPFFRELAPLVARKLENGDGLPVEAIAAGSVVDGLALQRAWKKVLAPFEFEPVTPLQLLQQLFVQLPSEPERARLQEAQDGLTAALNQLDDSVDAVGDALLAESVHQAVQGNPLRTASTLDAVASGEAPPPQLEVVRTPRTGIALTHRLVVLMGAPELPRGWEAPAVAYRADAEPRLNGWAAGLLGDPRRVRCVVERLDPVSSAVLETRELRLSQLRLAPLDYVYAAEESRGAQGSEIENRIRYALVREPDGFPGDAELRIDPRRGAGWEPSDLSYGEFAELVRTARRLITASRGIDASELNLPEANQAATIDLDELRSRADNAEHALHELQEQLRGQLDDAAAPDLEVLRDGILRASHFGVAAAVPLSTIGEGPSERESLELQGNSVLVEVTQRVERERAIRDAPADDGASETEQRNLQVARLQAIFGESFVVLPTFGAPNAAELEKALADSTKLQGNDPLAAVTWFQRASRVRDGVARLDASIRYAEALDSDRLNLRVAQLPYREEDRWVGLPLQPGRTLSPSRFSLVVQSGPELDLESPLAGVLVDEWVEVLPNPSETTGLVFQYDQPDAAPPQNILLAVPPDPEQPWNLWTLQQALLETLDLARLRAVDSDALDELGHFLPALYFAFNAAGDAVSTDFSALK